MSDIECKCCTLKSPATRLLSPKQLDELEENCLRIGFRKGEGIIKEGMHATNIVYLRSGLVKIHMKGPSGEKILRLSKAPAYLGLPTTFGDKVNQYSATALTECEVCFISLDTFRRLIYSNGQFAYEIIIDMSRLELRGFKRCVSFSQKHLPGRLAEILIRMSEEIFGSTTYKLPLTVSELADFISSSRESVSRQLSEFVREEIIMLNKRELTICRMDILRKISEKG